MRNKIVFAMILTALFSAAAMSCLTGASLAPVIAALDRLRDGLAREAGPLEAATSPQNGPFVAQYWAEADKLSPGCRFPGTRLLGTIDAGGYRLGVVLLVPPSGAPARGTLVSLHGYMGYSGPTLPLLYRLAGDGWTVLAADLPGHGFSSGPAADIGDFLEYGACVRGVINWINARKTYDFRAPLVLMGHSTGGSAVLEALWRNPADVDRAVLLAPLLELRSFGITGGLAGGAAFFIPSVPMPGPRAGYLTPYSFPFSWLEAYDRFRTGLSRRPALTLPVLVVQGDDDRTLDWRTGLADMRRIAPGAEVRILAGCGHTLFDRGRAQVETLAAVRAFLNDAPGK
ncbi:MAG: alpha/beta hydrolase [Spirochaetales bacterium]|nr:alpha/beta hydrolase [Spirochaetales bacterium]